MAGPPEKPPDPQPDLHLPEKSVQPAAKKEVKNDGWINKLAQQSAGLSSPKPSPPPEEQGSAAQLWRFAGVGLQFAGTTAIFAVIGVYLDHRFGWTPWGAVACTMIGAIGGFYLLLKDAMRMNK